MLLHYYVPYGYRGHIGHRAYLYVGRWCWHSFFFALHNNARRACIILHLCIELMHDQRPENNNQGTRAPRPSQTAQLTARPAFPAALHAAREPRHLLPGRRCPRETKCRPCLCERKPVPSRCSRLRYPEACDFFSGKLGWLVHPIVHCATKLLACTALVERGGTLL